jgi:hypothetical protein
MLPLLCEACLLRNSAMQSAIDRRANINIRRTESESLAHFNNNKRNILNEDTPGINVGLTTGATYLTAKLRLYSAGI